MTSRMTSYKPVQLVFKVSEPRTDADGTLLPIIFMHGLTQSKETWKGITQRIADATKRKVYAYDARNHGESEYSEHFSFDLNVEDLFYFMDTNNITKAILVGHSMGGATATYAALSKPERIDKVFVEDMFVKNVSRELIEPSLPLFYARKESTLYMPKGLNEQEAREFSNNFLIEKIPKDSPLRERLDEIRKARLNLKKNTNDRWELGYNSDVIVRALKNADTLLSEPKGQYHGPAYFIYGSVSPIAVQKERETIRKHFPKAKFIEIEGAGHSIHSDFCEEFVTNVLNNL